MKLFVMACFGSFIAIMVLDLVSGLFSSIFKGKNKDKKDRKEGEQGED